MASPGHAGGLPSRPPVGYPQPATACSTSTARPSLLTPTRAGHTTTTAAAGHGHSLSSSLQRAGVGTVKQVCSSQGGGGSQHSYTVEEAAAFAAHINASCGMEAGASKGLQHLLPIAGPDDLFNKVADGLLLCRLINIACPDTVDERVLNWPGGGARPTTTTSSTTTTTAAAARRQDKPLNHFQMAENINVALSSARAIGCTVVNGKQHARPMLLWPGIHPPHSSFSSLPLPAVHAADVIAGAAGGKQHIVLGLVWQVVRAQLLSRINLKAHPELARLLLPGESLKDLLACPPEEVLIRWFNYHLGRVGHAPITNLSADVRDCEAYWHLLASIDKSCLPQGSGQQAWSTGMQGLEALARAPVIIESAARLGVPTFITPADIVSGNKRLNLAFTASLFNTAPGLAELDVEEQAAVTDAAQSEGQEDAREARQFRFWLNSLALGPPGSSEPLYLPTLYPALSDGLVCLWAIEKVAGPGKVDWRRVNQDKSKMNKFKAVENCNQAILLGRSLGFHLPGIGGSDVQEGNPKLVLGFLWQLMRMQFLGMLGSMGANVKDADIMEWANRAVSKVSLPLPPQASPPTHIHSFKDPTLASGIYYLALLEAVQPGILDPSLVSPGQSAEESGSNARYVISAARKLGATVFITWEDLTECRPKAVQQLLAALMHRAQQGESKQHAGVAPAAASTTPVQQPVHMGTPGAATQHPTPVVKSAPAPSAPGHMPRQAGPPGGSASSPMRPGGFGLSAAVTSTSSKPSVHAPDALHASTGPGGAAYGKPSSYNKHSAATGTAATVPGQRAGLSTTEGGHSMPKAAQAYLARLQQQSKQDHH